MKLRDQQKGNKLVGLPVKVLILKPKRMEYKEAVRMEVISEDTNLNCNRRKLNHRNRSTIPRISMEAENHCAKSERSNDEHFLSLTTNRQMNKSADIVYHNQLPYTFNQLKSYHETPLHPATIQESNMRRNPMSRPQIKTGISFSRKAFNSKLISVLVATALISCIFTINQAQALSSQASADSSMIDDDSTPAKASAPNSALSATHQDDKPDLNHRLDSLGESSPSVVTASQSSIVASLSSAVASAAAAAAVAAAKSSLSSSDARSLLSAAANNAGSHHHNHQQHAHQSRSPGLNLALKIADAIPEVPYNILHNMKKVDHAAPFYNVPNKLAATGSGKESGHNLLATALSASAGGLTGAADQLSSLFKSPLWKRIADGYGEFSSEFRSLFRAPPTTMKGPTSSATTKLLRDISVPALLMLLASAIPSDWRPVRTRRKSLIPSVSQSATDPMMASPSEQPYFSLPPAQLFKMPQSLPNMVSQMPSSMSRSLNPLSQSSQGSFNNQAGEQQVIANPSGQSNMITPVASDSSAWMSSQQPTSGRNQNFDQQQAIKRIGDTYSPAISASLHTSGGSDMSAEQEQLNIKPVKQQQQHQAGLFSSLTSSLNNAGRSKLTERIINTGGAGDNYLLNSYRIMSLTDGIRRKSISARKDQLSDKHRYSLVGLEDSSPSAGSPPVDSLNERKSLPLGKPSPFLSAMTHILSSMLNGESSSLKSGSPSAIANTKEATINHHGQETVGARTINHGDFIARRQLLPQTLSSNPEQRELSQLLPQSWREAVKRTMNTVQHQASTQWRSIEGQVTNWVQDKLKTLPVTGSSSHPTGASSPAAASAPVANIIASVSSTAMNMLGLGNNKGSSSSPSSIVAANSSSGTTTDKESGAAPGESLAAQGASQKGKNDIANKSPSPVQAAKGALVGVASMIVNSFTNRQQAPSSSSPLGSKASSASESQSVISSYPTMSSAQLSATQSMASSTASTASALTSSMKA